MPSVQRMVKHMSRILLHSILGSQQIDDDEQRKPYFQQGLSSGKLTIVTFQHGKVGIDPRSLKHQFALLPRHHGITSKSFASFQGFNDESQQSY